MPIVAAEADFTVFSTRAESLSQHDGDRPISCRMVVGRIVTRRPLQIRNGADR